MSVRFRDYLEERLKDDSFRAEYEAIERETLHSEREYPFTSTRKRYVSGNVRVPAHA